MSNYSFNEGSNKKPFWKRNSTKFPGSSTPSPSQKNEDRVSSSYVSGHKLTFKEFENHTEDAWDAEDDDLLRTALAKIKMGSSPEQVYATAQAVIDHHSRTKSLPVISHSQSITTTAKSNEGLEAKVQCVKLPNTRSLSSQSKKFPGGATRTMIVHNDANTSDQKVAKLESQSYNDHTQSETSNGYCDESYDTSHTEPHKEVEIQSSESNNIRISLLPPSLQGIGSAPKNQSIRMPMQASNHAKENSRLNKFYQLINDESTDLDELRKLSWPGIPSPVRAVTWQLLSGYLPANKDRRETVLSRKRKDYFNFVNQYYEAREQAQYQTTFRQIHIDIPRTNPLIPLFQQPTVQHILERLLFVWAIRHPASGYVQGINDLVTPFFIVFLSAQIDEKCDVETFDVSLLSESILKDMEADTFWCTSNLLDGIQDNYTFAQPGVQTKVNKLRELTKRVDAELHAHLEAEQIEYLQFAFRWMNNLLMREIPLRCTIRLWDTYLAENDGFSDFHLYTCAAFLKHWRNQLLSEKDFQGLMLMIQNVPTHHWGEEEIKLLLAEAFRLKYMFADAPSHLPDKR